MIYIFNPDADLALSEPGHNYLPPAPIRRMAQDLALLPAWYAPAGSIVSGCSEADRQHLQWLQTMFDLDVRLEGDALFQYNPDRTFHTVSPNLLANQSNTTKHCINPWGWNKTLRRRLLLMGLEETLLPSVEQLDAHRKICSRLCTADILEHFNKMGLEQVEGRARVVRSMTDISQQLLSPFLLKSLWSGSGKGLYWCRQGFSPDAQDWARRVLKRDGALMLEPIYNKVHDFAMEFQASADGEVSFVGYSRFLTNTRGAYQANLLASDGEIERWLTRFVPLETLLAVRSTLQHRLSALIRSLNFSATSLSVGPIGVDMMLYTSAGENDTVWLHPCVEVNFRTTMGLVAHTFTRCFLAPEVGSASSDIQARFQVESFPSSEALRLQHKKEEQMYPLIVRNQRLVSGYLPLTPVTETATYRICVIVDR